MKILIKNTENLRLPHKSSEDAVGYDIYTTTEPKIVGKVTPYSNTYYSIDYIEYGTNIFLAPEFDRIRVGDWGQRFCSFIFPRSSISKYNLLLANSLGVCDADYRGEFLLRYKYIVQPENLVNIEDEYKVRRFATWIDYNKMYKKKDKIAQLIFMSGFNVDFELVDELPETKRGSGGFGSSGA